MFLTIQKIEDQIAIHAEPTHIPVETFMLRYITNDENLLRATSMLEGFQLHPQNKIPPQKYTACLQLGTQGSLPCSALSGALLAPQKTHLPRTPSWSSGRGKRKPTRPPARLPATWEKKEKKKYPGFLQMSVLPASSSLALPSRAGKEDSAFSCPVTPPTGRKDPGMPRPRLNPSFWKRSKNEGGRGKSGI